MQPRLRMIVIAALLMTVLLAGCTRDFKQSVIPAQAIPIAMRERVDSDRQEVRNVVWHAYFQQDGYEIAVLSYDKGDARELISHRTWEWLVFRDGAPVRPPGLSQDLSFVLGRYGQAYTPPAKFYWQPHEHLNLRLKTGENSASICGVGYAWTVDAHRVVGTTFNGRVFEAPVVNGYWILLDLDIQGVDRADRFETVDLLDKDGKVLHTYARNE